MQGAHCCATGPRGLGRCTPLSVGPAAAMRPAAAERATARHRCTSSVVAAAVASRAAPGWGVPFSKQQQQQFCSHRSQQQQQQRRAPLPVRAAAADSPSSSSGGGKGAEEEDFGYMREYAALKSELLDNTRKAGGAIGAYLLLTAGGAAALSCMLGVGASYVYFSWLCKDVDSVGPTDRVPIWEANKIENPVLRGAAKVAAAYRAALRPRLLVPVGMASAVGIWNALSGEPVPLLYEGCLLGGFLAYKGALITKLLQELLPKSYGSQGESRPRVEVIEDDLDQWGRPRKASRTPIDALPEDQQAKVMEQLQKQEEEEAEKERLLAQRAARAAAEREQRRQQQQGGGGAA